MTEAFTFVPRFLEHVQDTVDDTKQYAVSTTPNFNLVMNGSDVCTADFPTRFSFLFKFSISDRRSSVTLLNIKGQLKITLDVCNATLILDYGGEFCSFRRAIFSLRTDLETGVWHKIGLAFAGDHLAMYVNCRLTEWLPITGCGIQCNEGIDIGLLTPTDIPSCSSNSEVSI